MRRLIAREALSLDDYRLETIEAPAPDQGQVRIRVAACSLGYVDGLMAVGGYQVKPPLPYTPGSDIAGTVDAVGEGVPADWIGARVVAQVRFGLCDYTLAPAAALNRIPKNVAFETAAVFHTNYTTALHGLQDRAAIAPGERLLVFGAAGGVGSAAMDVGRALGAEVIAVGSTPEKRAFALEHGAAHVLDTAPQGFRDRLKAVTDGKGPDVIFDPVCGPLFEPAFRSLAWRGRHLVVGFVGGPIPALPSNLPLMKGAALLGVDIRQFPIFETATAAANLRTLLGWLGEGRLRPAVGKVFALEDYAQALDLAMSGAGFGKAVIRLD